MENELDVLTPPPPAPTVADEGHVLPFSQAELEIQKQVATPEATTERLRTAMNPEGSAPRDKMTFGENVSGQFQSGTVIGSRVEAGALEAVQSGGASMRNRGFTDAQLRQMPSRVRTQIEAEERALTPEQTAARLTKAEDDVFQQAAFDLSQSRLTPQSVAGGLVANIALAPENFINLPARAAVAAGGAIKSMLPSATPAIQRVLLSGVEAAAMNVATDPLVQGARTVSGGQDEYNLAQTALAAPMGFAAGAALRGGVEGVGALRTRQTAPAVADAPRAAEPVEQVPAATPEPNAAITRPSAPEPVRADASPVVPALSQTQMRIPPEEMIADFSNSIQSGSIDVKRFSKAPTSEQIDKIIALGDDWEKIRAKELFGTDADRIMRMARRGSDSLDETVSAYGREAERFIFGYDNANVFLKDDLVSLRKRIVEIEHTASEGDLNGFGKEVAWIAPKLPDPFSSAASHSSVEREAILSLSAAYDAARNNGIDINQVFKEAVIYTGKRVGGDVDDTRILLDRLAAYNQEIQKTGDPTQPVVPAVSVEPPRLLGAEPPRLPAHTVTTAAGTKIDVAPVVVDASSLRVSSDAGYAPELQPRDRSRAASDAQVRDIAVNLQPERLGLSAEADRGAPIVGADGMVESGNGRMMAVRQAYAEGGEAAARYRAWVEGLGVDTTGMKEPVIVRQRLTELTPEERQRFTVEANQSATLSMSASEKALADAGRLTPDALTLIRDPNDMGAAANRDFIKAFSQSLPVSERGAFMTADGLVSSEGMTRVKNAVLARAYGDNPVLARVAEAADDDAKSLSGALVAAAPEWAKLKAEIEAGAVRGEVDDTSNLIEAIRRTIDIRGRGQTFDGFIRQQDAFDVLPDSVKAWMEMFYQPGGKRAAGKDIIAERLRYYAQEARKVSADDGLFGDAPVIRAADLQAVAAKKGLKDGEGQRGLFDPGQNRNDANTGTRGEAGREQAPSKDSGQVQGRVDAEPEVQAAVATPGSGRVSRKIREIKDRADGIIPNAQARSGTAATAGPGQSFPRRQLAGEVIGRQPMPTNASPAEIFSFRMTDAIADLADRLGRKVEMDGRFTIKGALGEYKVKPGVIRLRHEGDFQIFTHEAGHAIDADLKRIAGPDWMALRQKHAAELKPMDGNVTDPAKQTVDEGLAEFMRSYITNPAYVRKQAPNFAADFDAFIDAKAPHLRQWFTDAARVQEIDSNLAPSDVMRGMVVDQVDPGKWKAFRDTWKKEGLPIALRDVTDVFTTAVAGKDQPVYRMVRTLLDAQYEKTGQPAAKEFTWDDPYKRYRMLPGAKQAAVDALYDGVRQYGNVTQRTSGSLYDALKLAYGRVDRVNNPDDPLVKDFSAYLVAKRSEALYRRYRDGDLRNPPVRASENEVKASIADFDARYPNFVQASDGVFAFARAMFEKKRDAGLISDEIFQAVTTKDGSDRYVPFYRDLRDQKTGGVSRGTELEQAGKVNGFGGSSRDILDPIQSIMLDAVQTERIIAHNDFVKALHRLAEGAGEFGGKFIEKVPNKELKGTSVDIAEAVRVAAKEAGLEKADAEIILRQMEEMIGDDLTATVFRATDTTARGERILFYWDGGERTAIKIGSDKYSRDLFDVVSRQSQAERDIFLGMLGRFNSLFSQFIVNAPQFALKNIIMDNISRMFIARNTGIMGRVPGAAIVQGAWTMAFDREFAKAYDALGGLRGGPAAAALRELDKSQGFGGISLKPETLSDKAAAASATLGSPKSLGKAALRSPLTIVESVVKAVEATETLGRVGQAKIVFNHLKAQGLSDAEAMRGALFEARDILDYDRTGDATKAIRALVPFLNVGIQGTSRANQNLITDPAKAIAQWNARGRDWSKVDADMKSALHDGLMNWGMIAAGLATVAGYHAWVSDSDAYRKSSDYMRRRYFIIPLGVNDANGDETYLTMPKPFDLPGALMSALESTLEWQKRADPDGFAKVSKALADGFIPRQLESAEALVSSMPQIKVTAEVALGKQFGFDGRKAREIIPQSLKSLPPEMQFTGNTGWLPKKLGEMFGVSPLMAEHVINGLGATTARDAGDLLTATFDNNPNMTPSDAFTKLFFGGLYRRQRGVGDAGADIRQAMGADGGKMIVAANGYRKSIETGDRETADIIYNKADDVTKTVMTMRGHDFAPAERQLNPMERAETIAEIAGKVARDLASSKLEIADRTRRRGEERDFIEVAPQIARTITNTINAMASEEIMSSMAIAGVPGYQNAKVIDGSARLDFIRGLSPEVADEIQARMTKAHLLPIATVQEAWPEAKRRLLYERMDAKLGDLLPAGTKLPKRRR